MTAEAFGPGLAVSVDRMDRGTEFFGAELGRLGEVDLAEPSRLPGWTRQHVVAHIARNARALTNLLRWAETGVESPMYPSREQRDADIEAGARLPPAEARADAIEAMARFRQAISAVPAQAWAAEVRTSLGQPLPAGRVPWLRTREVWVHGVDLGTHATFADIDEEVAAALLDETAAALAGREDCPSVLLVAGGAHPSRHLIGPDTGSPLETQGSTQDLAGWLLGRTAGAGVECPVELPDLPRWL